MTTNRNPGFIGATEAAQRDLQKRIRTTVPATVVAYDAVTRRAAVQPAPSLVTGGREGRALPPIPHVPVMFPGGGAQYAGMARDLYETEPVFADWMDKGLDLLIMRAVCCIPGLPRISAASETR